MEPDTESKNSTKSSEDSVEIELSHPIDISGVKTSKLIMREPSIGDRRRAKRQAKNEVLRRLDKKILSNLKGDPEVDEEDVLLILIGNLCGLGPDEMDQIKTKDQEKLLDAVLGFLDSKE